MPEASADAENQEYARPDFASGASESEHSYNIRSDYHVRSSRLSAKPIDATRTGAKRATSGAHQTNGSRHVRRNHADEITTALGWFSVGLGAAELLAPGALSRLIGLGSEKPRLLRAFGIREITSGIGILSNPRPGGWVWSRVAGDIVDLSLLGLALVGNRRDRGKTAIATALVAGVTALDVIKARQLSLERDDHVVRVAAVTIKRTPQEVYRFWRDFTNLPRFMSHLQSVELIDQDRSRWTAVGPGGASVGWLAQITNDQPDKLISWRSLPGSDVEHSGSVRFDHAPAGRGTEVRVALVYNPPAGLLGVEIAKVLGREPGEQIKGDLYRLKQVLETGEVVHSDPSVHQWLHPARPS